MVTRLADCPGKSPEPLLRQTSANASGERRMAVTTELKGYGWGS